MRELEDFLKHHRKYGNCFYRGRKYNLAKVTGSPSRFDTSGNRTQLIEQIISDKSESDITNALNEFSNDQTPKRFLDRLSERCNNPGDIVSFFKSHYGETCYKMLRHLIYHQHKKVEHMSRVGKLPHVSWQGNMVDLMDHSTQGRIYRYMLDNALDPICFRLALSPQFWWSYCNKDFDEMINSITAKYRRIVKGKSNVNYDCFLASVKKHFSKLPKHTRWYVGIACIYMRKLQEKLGLQIYVPTDFQYEGTFVPSILSSAHLNQYLRDFPKERMIEALRNGLQYNPWDFLKHVNLYAQTDGKFVDKCYSHILTSDEFIAMYDIEPIWSQ